MNVEIAILFCEDSGTYSYFKGLHLWGIEKDARLYKGPYSVIAHPPCQLWGKMAPINYKRWGGEHNRPGNDGGCFESALWSVEMFGGVLEHPAYSKAWERYKLDRPEKGKWTKSRSGWVCEVWQSAYGHVANKATWLYCVSDKKPYDLDWRRLKGTHQIGGADQRGKNKNKPTIRGKKASETPILFAIELIRLVIYSNKNL